VQQILALTHNAVIVRHWFEIGLVVAVLDKVGIQQRGGVLPDRAAQWVADVIGRGSRITSARRLHPGGWHVNHAVAVADRHGRTHVVRSRFGRVRCSCSGGS